MNEIEVINILKRYTDKKERERERQRVIKSSQLLFTASIWSHLTHSRPVLNDMCRANYKTLGNR